MISARLFKEAISNIGLEVSSGVAAEGMKEPMEVRARGEMQLAVLIESMRRCVRVCV